VVQKPHDGGLFVQRRDNDRGTTKVGVVKVPLDVTDASRRYDLLSNHRR
jgi:hypothetical protein